MTRRNDRYTKLGGGAIEFRVANLTALAQGSCLAGKTDQWRMKGNKIPLQSKSDLLRLLLLWKYGGAWIDTDTVLLRDIRPIIVWGGGDIGGKFAMTQKYNNAFLALRKQSKVAAAMLGLACKYPRGADYGGYCTAVGLPCHSDWWCVHTRAHAHTRTRMYCMHA